MPTEFDISQAAAAIYADSLLELATAAGQAQAVNEELAQLAELWRREPVFADLMRSAAIDSTARAESIRRVFSGRLSTLVLNLLLVLNRRHRTMTLPQVCRSYRLKLEDRLNQQEALVTSAVPLEEPHRQRLREHLKRLIGKDPILVERVDPDLLGGLRIQVADRLFDASVRQQLIGMRRALQRSIEKNLRGNIHRFVT